MSDEDFLARWSRRKRAAEEGKQADEQAEPSDQLPPSDAEAAGEASGHGEQNRKQPDDEAFDPASLPPVESITAETDVTAFLRKGVPPELARAALRRAWVADPAIRDFIGLVENSWDFNDPTAIPGFGPLDQTPAQVSRMLADLFGEARQAAGEVAEHMTQPVDQDPSATAPEITAAKQADVQNGEQERESGALANDVGGVATPEDGAHENAHDIAPQHSDAPQPGSRPRRSHGSALPQ